MHAAKPGTVRAEPSRNLIIIQGNSADRRAAIDTVLSFDADWMLGQSIGIYPVSNSTPEPIIAELNRIIDLGRVVSVKTSLSWRRSPTERHSRCHWKAGVAQKSGNVDHSIGQVRRCGHGR